MRSRALAVVVVGLVLVAACGSDSESGSTDADAVDVAAYQWEQVADGAPWGGRAGLRVVELDGALFLLGGRTPRQSDIPGDSDIWADVWRSDDLGGTWEPVLTGDTPAPWPARAYFQAVTTDDAIYVLGGQDFGLQENPFCELLEQGLEPPPSLGIDPDAPCPEFLPTSEFFSDVWSSPDGETWTELTSDAGWAGRAGLSAAVHDGQLYVLGGSRNDDSSIIGDCIPPYFNDVWRSVDGTTWEEVSAAASWSPRPGHQCEVLGVDVVCFGGFGLEENPTDVWFTRDGVSWTEHAAAAWNVADPDGIRYDFESITVDTDDGPVVLTFGGDRETFDFTDPDNWLRIEDDVWRLAPAGGAADG